MKTLPPKYTDLQLQSILETDTQFPNNINEYDFRTDLKDNTKIKWRVNHFLFNRNSLPYLLDSATFKKWKVFKSLNWIFVLLIVGFAAWTSDYKILFFLIVYAFFIIPFDHWIFIFNISVIIAIKLLFKISVSYFWLFVTVTFLGYLLNKVADEMIEKKILKQALYDWTTFWKYYSSKIIWMDESALNDEYKRLTDKYSELRN